MIFIKHSPILVASFALAVSLSSCSKDDNNLVTPVDPENPSGVAATLTQFDVILGDQTTSGIVSSRTPVETQTAVEAFNNPKTAFTAGDSFIFQYINALQTTQKAYAYTADGKTWTIHETEDANSQVKTIYLDSKMPKLSATFLSRTAVTAGADKDGILAESGEGGKILVGCFDALSANAAVTINSNKATAKIPFQHVNHLLNFHIKGTLNEEMINRLELNVTYTNAGGVKQNAVLSTSSRASYADTEGKTHTVIQAIVPRDGVVKGIQAIKNDNASITTTDPINIECPSGKSHLVALNVNDNKMSVQVGSLTDGWAFSGELNSDGSPVGDIYIGTAEELRTFASSVGTNPTMPAAKINGVVAYTAHVVQTANIDLSSLDWRPIGGESYNDDEKDPQTSYFAGTFNGNGFKITGMKVTTNTAAGNSLVSHAGLFGKVESPEGGYAILTNIQLENVTIQLTETIQYSKAGALVGYAYAPAGKNQIIMSQCSAQGTITINNNSGEITAGGLVGEAVNTHITGSTTNVSIVANAKESSYAGGMVGRAQSSSIVNSFAQNTVSGQSSSAKAYSGGITGSLSETNQYSYVIACRSDGNVVANGTEVFAGGIAGYNSGNIAGSYAKGNATSTSANGKTGAIVALKAGKLNLCYGVGTVGVGNSNAGMINNSIVYNTNPAAGDILSIVSGKAWKDSHNGEEMAEATTGGILTVFAINTGGKQTLEVKPRLWVLSDPGVWSTSSPASTTYPIPDKNYKGQ